MSRQPTHLWMELTKAAMTTKTPMTETIPKKRMAGTLMLNPEPDPGGILKCVIVLSKMYFKSLNILGSRHGISRAESQEVSV